MHARASAAELLKHNADVAVHGSRFTIDGELLQGAAVKDLAPAGAQTKRTVSS